MHVLIRREKLGSTFNKSVVNIKTENNNVKCAVTEVTMLMPISRPFSTLKVLGVNRDLIKMGGSCVKINICSNHTEIGTFWLLRILNSVLMEIVTRVSR